MEQEDFFQKKAAQGLLPNLTHAELAKEATEIAHSSNAKKLTKIQNSIIN